MDIMIRYLVFISILVAIVATYAAFLFSEEVKSSTESKYQQKMWLFAGSIALGGGIWGMHFIGMFAYKLPITVYYDALTTFISVIPAVLAGIVVLNSHKEQTFKSLLLRSVIMGGSIGLMHYIGMVAMRLNASMLYSLGLFVLSIVVAVILSVIALYTKQWASSNSVNKINKKILLVASIIMGCAISGMHYTGMAAVYFIPFNNQMNFFAAMQADELLMIVGLVMLGVFLLLLSAVVISRRIELITQLKASQHQLQKIFDSTLDAMVIINGSGCIESINMAVKDIFGYSSDEVVGKNINIIFHKNDDDSDDDDDDDDIFDDNDDNDGNFDDVIKLFTQSDHKDGRGNKHELQAKAQNGRLFPIELSISKANFSGTSHFICVIRDISERKRIDKFLRDTTAKISAIVDTVPDAIFTINQYGIIQTMNPAVERIFGYYIGELEDQNITMLVSESYCSTDDSYSQNYIKSGDEEIIGKTREVGGKHKKGHLFPLELSINEFYIGDEHYFTLVAKDISERKVAEKELKHHRDNLQQLVLNATLEIKAIVQTAVNGVISINQNGIVNLFNPAAEMLFGWKSNEVVGNNVAMLVPEIGISTHDQYIKRFIDTGKTHIIGIGREVLALRKDGTTFPANLSIGHSELGQGKHLFVGFIEDITAQKQAEKELLLAKNNAEQAARSKANFLANMSHEIRTPMNAVIGFSEIVIQDPSLSNTNKQYVNTILNSAKNLLGIINDILDFSKIEAGKVDLESVCFHLPNAMQDTLSTLEFKAAEKDLILNLTIDKELPERLLGDPARLRQVILNLVGNAIKFTPSGSVSVDVKRQPDSNLILFSIHDTGIGMTPSQVKEVFKAFSQADASTNRKFGGTGLGTTISKQIVELMGGEVWAESVVEKGSTFYFTAKLAEAKNIESCLFENGAYVQSDYKSPRIFKVLLAEDIAVNATLATLRLEQQGHQVTWVKNGQLAVNAVKNEEYDIVLMDIQMPELDGLSATQLIRQQETETGESIPIIALTASVMEEDRQQCFDVGMNAIVGKPINFSELPSSMEAFVSKVKGTSSNHQIITMTPEVAIDFSPLNDVVDHQAGLAIWNDPFIYAQSLISFARERQDDANKMRILLNSNPSDLEPVRAISHALKGVAGNLAISSVASITDEIDNLLKVGEIQTVEDKLSILAQLLKKITDAIALLVIPAEENKQTEQILDLESIEGILKDLTHALDELNPDATEPYLKQLRKSIKIDELKMLQHNIASFDFDLAKKEVYRLAKRLNITGID